MHEVVLRLVQRQHDPIEARLRPWKHALLHRHAFDGKREACPAATHKAAEAATRHARAAGGKLKGKTTRRAAGGGIIWRGEYCAGVNKTRVDTDSLVSVNIQLLLHHILYTTHCWNSSKTLFT